MVQRILQLDLQCTILLSEFPSHIGTIDSILNSACNSQASPSPACQFIDPFSVDTARVQLSRLLEESRIEHRDVVVWGRQLTSHDKISLDDEIIRDPDAAWGGGLTRNAFVEELVLLLLEWLRLDVLFAHHYIQVSSQIIWECGVL